MKGTEPLSGYEILAIEGSLNGEAFACNGGNCSVPLDEGENNFTFWALSSWGDSSEMGIFSAKVDVTPPALGLDISAASGTNGWYVSPVSIVATGSDTTSGLASVLLSVDNGAWESSTALNEGVYNLAVQAVDYAGNTSNTSTTISVDTTTPAIDLSLSGMPGNDGWYISNVEVTASATDATSGVASLAYSLDGNSYQTYTAPVFIPDGHHTIQFKAIDNAGNETETPMQAFDIDTVAPAVALPASWEVDDTIEYSLQDDGSGLSDTRVVIEDEDEKYDKIVWIKHPSGVRSKGEITWDGKFADKTIAPPGEYHVWIKTSDKAGNERFVVGIVTVPSPFDLFALPTAEPTPKAIPTPPKELFEEETHLPTQAAPTISTTSFGNSTSLAKAAEGKAFSVTPTTPVNKTTTNSNVLWGATAAAVIGVATAYALDEQRKRKEREAQQLAEAQAEAAKRNAAEQARKTQAWLEGQAILNAQIEEARKQGATEQQIALLRKQGAEQGLGVAIGSSIALTQGLADRNAERLQAQNERMANKMSRFEREEEARWQAMQTQQGLDDPLACTPDNPYGIPRVNPRSQTALDWLIGLYENANLPGATALDRTRWILDATENGPEFLGIGYPHTHFNLVNLAPGDSGFDPKYQDSGLFPNNYSSDQNGHFLTALDFSLYANDSRLSDISKGTRRWIALSSIIGHEMVGDDVGKYEHADLTSFIQTGVGMLVNIVTLNAVNRWFLSGEDKNFQKIIGNKLGQGNSIEDLRLSYEGWIAGEEITNGDIQTPQEFSQWIKDTLK